MRTLILACAVLASAAPALAADDMDFMKVDTDKNGMATSEEMMKAMPTMTKEDMMKADTDKSGDLSKAEFDMMMKSKM